MSVLRIAAVQATYVLMNRDATIDKVEKLTAEAAQEGAQLVVFPEVFVPGTPIWIDTRPIWDGDDEWFAMLMANAVVLPSPAADRLAMIAEKNSVWLVVGVQEREPRGSTIYNTVLYFAPEGRLAGRHRKLVPTGSERTVWGMGDGSTLRVVDTPFGRICGLICWENYMPLARFHLYAQVGQPGPSANNPPRRSRHGPPHRSRQKIPTDLPTTSYASPAKCLSRWVI